MLSEREKREIVRGDDEVQNLAARGRKGAREFDSKVKKLCDDFWGGSEFDLQKISFALILQG